MLSSRAADRQRQVALPLPHEARKEEAEELVELLQELLVLGHLLEEADDLAIEACLPLEMFHEKGILQETDVEDQVGLHGYSVLEAERHHRRLKRHALLGPRELGLQEAPQLVRVETGRVDDSVREIAHIGHLSALASDRGLE